MQLNLFKKEQLNQLQKFEEDIKSFSEFPYKYFPYNKRNWGHGYHFLCSYQSKLKPSIAHFLVKLFTRSGDLILDPFSGAGTIPFEACLQGRIGIGIDINPVAFHNTNAKLHKPDKEEIWKIINEMEIFIKEYELNDDDKSQILCSNINGYLQDYYDKKTFNEILKARKFFIQKSKNNNSPSNSLIFASLLHILHGNRPYALSRRSHGITPFSPTGEFIYKSLINSLRKKISRVISTEFPEEYVSGKAYQNSIFKFSNNYKLVDHIITSPPFINSTRFYLNNWIRLWFCGWMDGDFNSSKRNDFIEELQAKNISIYEKVFEKLKKLIKINGLCIMHLGVVKNRDMGIEIVPYAENTGFKKIKLIYEDVQKCESHGVTDQGSTLKHSFLFLKKINE